MSKLTFHVARHVADLIRNEPRNVGVIVSDQQRLVARFMGETSPGSFDLRNVKPSVIADRQLYAEWRRLWRMTLDGATSTTTGARDRSLIERAIAPLLDTSTPAFAVQPGGEWYVEAELLTAEDLNRIAEEIYRRVVDPAAQPFSSEESDAPVAAFSRRIVAPSRELGEKISAVFREANILETSSGATGLFAAHPVRLDQTVKGRNPVPHVPKFVQDNGQRYVIEQVDFDVVDGEAAREHAAYAAYMLGDIQQLVHAAGAPALPVNTIAVINRVSAAEARRDAGGTAGELVKAQEYGMAVLADQKDLRIVRWDDPTEREQFIEERIAVARGERH